jgi:hypothetical protein
VQDAKITVYVAQRDGQIGLVGHLGEAVPAGHLHPVVVSIKPRSSPSLSHSPNIRRHLYWSAWVQTPCARAVDVLVAHLRADVWPQMIPSRLQLT